MSKDLVVFASYSSDNGYNESNIIDMIIFLGSLGISATYTSNAIGSEGIFTYQLLCKKDEIEEATLRLREYGSTKK